MSHGEQHNDTRRIDLLQAALLTKKNEIRTEWFLLKVIPQEYEEFPGTILTNLLVREFEKEDGNWYEPNMVQHEEGGKWGLGEIVKKWRDTVRITPIEIRMKIT